MSTIIGKDTTFTGTLDVKGALRVDGMVNGKILCSDCVTIGATGQVEADVESDTAVIAGKMMGNVHTTSKIELQAKCEMEGDIKTNSLVIEQGAIFCGACNMKDKSPNLGFLPPDKKEQSKDSLVGSESEKAKSRRFLSIPVWKSYDFCGKRVISLRLSYMRFLSLFDESMLSTNRQRLTEKNTPFCPLFWVEVGSEIAPVGSCEPPV